MTRDSTEKVVTMKPRSTLAGLLLGCAFFTSAAAQDFVWAPDFPVGAALPPISAEDQNGEMRGFADLVGGNGMLFMLSRSFDW